MPESAWCANCRKNVIFFVLLGRFSLGPLLLLPYAFAPHNAHLQIVVTRLRRTRRRSRKHNRHLRRLNSIVRQIFAIPKKVGNAIWTRVLKRTQNARATSANHKLLPTDKPRHNTTRQDKTRQNRTGLNKSAHSGQLNVTRAIVADFVFGARSEVHSSCALRPCLTVATQSFVVCGNMFGFLGANVVIRITNCFCEKWKTIFSFREKT